MNILVLNYEFPPIGGGASPVAYDISKGYVKRGHNVHVVTMQYEDLPKDEVVEGISIHRVKCLRKERFVCHPWEQLTYIVSAINYLRSYIKTNSVDYMHVHFVIPTGVIAWYLNKKKSIPYIITAHGSDIPGYNNKRFGVLHKLLKKPWRRIILNAESIIAPSRFLEDLICKGMKAAGDTTFCSERIELIPNGIDTSIYRSSNKKKTILLMGRLQETKGMQDVLECLDKDTLGEWDVLVVGDGPYRNELEKIADNRGIKEKVRFTGWIESKSERQLEILAESAIFVSASYFENCPMTLMEAYCSGCKLVVSDIRGHREIAQERAVYFELGNIEMIRSSIVNAMNSYSFNDTGSIDRNVYDWDEKILQYEKLMKLNQI